MNKFGQKKIGSKKGKRGAAKYVHSIQSKRARTKRLIQYLNGDLFAYALPFSIYQQQHQHNIAIL